MDLNSLLLTLIPILGIGALGVYLTLASGGNGPGKLERRIGAGLMGLSLLVLGLFVGRRFDGWPPESALQSGAYSALFALLACSSIVSATFTVACRRSTHSVVWFAVLLLSNAGLYVFLGAHFLGIVTILAFAGAITIARLSLSRRAERQVDQRTDHVNHEPFLTCVTGTLLSVALVGTLHFAIATEAKHTIAAEEKQDTGSLRRSALPRQLHKQAEVVPDYHLLNNSLIVGALLFVLGTVGFLSRRSPVVMILAAGTLLQGVTLTLAAFGMFHGNWSGQILALSALAVAAAEVALVSALSATSVREVLP